MDYEQLLEELKNPEAEKVECKINFREEDFGRTIASFSTKKGGKIFLGVDNSRNPIGIIPGDKLNDRITQVARNCYPPACISIDRIPHDKDKYILCIKVEKGNGQIYTYKNIPYERREGVNHPLTPEETLGIQKNFKKIHYDELRAISEQRPGLISDIEESKVKDFLEFIGKKDMITKLDLKQYLINHNLTINGSIRVKNVAIMLFGKEPLKFIPQNRISIAIFPSDEITPDFVKKEISGDIIDIIRRTFLEIDRNNNVFSFVKDTTRTDIQEYPTEALREAVVNAVAHRDYFIDNSEIFIKIFKNRIEILNPGGFPYNNFTFEEIEKQGMSVRRNPLLATFLEKLNLMEQEGRGIARIKKITKEHGLPTPKIEVTQNTFKIIFYGIGKEVSNLLGSPYKKIINISGLNDRQKELLNQLKNKGTITTKGYAKYFKISQRTAIRDINNLMELDLVKKVGSGNFTRYILV